MKMDKNGLAVILARINKMEGELSDAFEKRRKIKMGMNDLK